jgi:hypothetical protein
MKKRPYVLAARLLGLYALLCCSLLSQPARAVTTTTFVTQGFTSSTFPPTGWSCNLVNSSFGWYWSNYGEAGVDGCAMMSAFYMYDYGYNNIYLQTPSWNGSAVGGTSADSMFVDFDAFLPENYYTYYDASCCSYYCYLNINVNGTQIKQISQYTSYTFFDQEYGYISQPSGYYGYSYWRHYHIQIPNSNVTSSMSVQFMCTSAGGYLPDNFGIDNVSIYNNRYTQSTSTPTALGFGSLGIGLTSAVQWVYINNPNAASINVSNVAILGSNPSDFVLTRIPTSIPAGKKDSVGVYFAPSAKGFRQAALAFNVNTDIGSAYVVTLTGTGLVPIIGLTPQPLYPFRGTKTRFRTTVQSKILVTNTGGSPLIISPTTYLGGSYPGEYRIVQIPTHTIAIGASDSIILAYSPTMEGAHYANLYINSNADNGQQTVVLYGIGILQRLVVSPGELNFDSVAMGTTQVDSIQLWNAGSDTLALTHNYFSSADGDFQLGMLTGTDTLIPPDGHKFVQVSFTPQQSGIRQARYRITTNIPMTFDSPSRDTSPFYVNIVGEGVPYGVLSAKGTPIVDSEIVGQQLCTTDTLFNKGSAPLTVTKYSLTGANASEYSITGVTLPVTIPAGGMYVFNVCITPTVRGDRNAMLNITSVTNGRTSTSQLGLDVFGQLVCASIGSPSTGFPAKTCVGSTDTAWVTITNCGDLTSTYTAALSNGATMYQIAGAKTTAPTTAGGTNKVAVLFTPTARGAAAGTLTITGTGGITETVTLDGSGGAASVTGNGTANLTQVGTSTSFKATITNAGECDWSPGAPTISGANAADFTCTGNTTKVIPAGGSDTLTFSYHPTTAGTSSAVASFPTESEASLPTPASVTLSGSAQTEGVAYHAEANGFVLAQNYPNPFNPMTEIRFTLPEDSHVQLDIVDLTGRIVRNVLSERMTAGNHGTVIDASELASGVYFYQLTAGSVKLTRQMMLAK